MEVLLAELGRDPAAVLRRTALAAVSAMAIVAAVISGGVAIQQRRHAAELARLSHDFGQEVAQIAATAHIAALLPLHDLRPDMARIKAHMATVEDHMKQLGEIADGPGHYVLGAGHAALEQWSEAARELEASYAAGYRSAELSYALGLAHGKLYQKALADFDKTDDGKANEARRQAIIKAHREPALRYLTEASRHGDTTNDPAALDYLRGLIAFYEERYDDALKLAREAATRSPSLFEARTLEGDIHVAIASDRYWKGDDDGDRAELQQAGPAFAAALEVARSSATALEGECRRLAGLVSKDAVKDELSRGSHEAHARGLRESGPRPT